VNLTFALFLFLALLIALAWNHWFTRVEWRYVALFVLLVSSYQARTLFGSKVDIPAQLAYHTQPWSSLGKRGVDANTGIVFTELAPWLMSARRSLFAGVMPLWNRAIGCGSPLLANQQTAIFHPFTMAGLFLPLGKAFTLSTSLRLYTSLFFFFTFLRNHVRSPAALFGAIAWTFSTFSILWLLFPLGLATFAIAPGLAAIEEFARRPRIASFVLLTIALALPILGGHPEQAMWVGLILGAYGLYARVPIGRAATAAVAAIALTAIFWLPTLEILPHTMRYKAFGSLLNVVHSPSFGWTRALLFPNALGTPQARNYHPPEPRSPGLLDDYGEVASGYAGAVTFVCGLAALFFSRERPAWFFAGTAVFALLTLTETPGWGWLLRHIPIVSLTMHQRLRFLWAISLVVLASILLDRLQPRLVYLLTAATLIELVVTTWQYNPPANPADVYPATGAIAALGHGSAPHRIVAIGWSLVADTPGAFGLEDVKTTDPISSPEYLRFFHGYLGVDPGDYDQIVQKVDYSFFDFLNIERIYVPPDRTLDDPDFEIVYRGSDGTVLRNRKVLPRYFIVPKTIVEPSFGMTVARSKQIADFGATALVDRPSPFHVGGAGDVQLLRYDPNGETLRVRSSGGLLITSDVNWPGWTARFDGKELEVVTANGAFVACWLPSGEGTLRLEYRPRGYVIGRMISIVAMLLVIIALSAIARRRRVSDEPSGVAAPSASRPR
jgi:hypothetical protein